MSEVRKESRKKIKLPLDDKIYYTVVYLILGMFTLIVLLPLINIVAASFSSPTAVATSRVILWPVDFSLKGYEAVFSNRYVLSGYRNTIFYTVLGTAINVSMTLLAAYPLSRRDMPFRGFFMFLFTFTMFFSGGLIPTFLLVNSLHMVGTFWALLLPGAISVYDMIITRTFIQSNIPGELLEAAQIDGCSDLRFFFMMVLPLSKAVIAVITLYYAVGHWNAYFSAMIYLNDKNSYPLQLILRSILIANQISTNDIQDDELIAGRQGMADLLKYSLIIVSSLPIICVYPFIQKYFVKGVMIGSIKG